ncbi:MAG: glycosyltransferase family 4 protein, partial [Oceanospirillales bacterium]|nr:glycosyltransferase family 4 protein [Oceanospirillales bacterium]
MTQNVLYISYTGLMDPLGQSQVLQYVLALGLAGHRMTVLSFEKPGALNDPERVAAIRTQCREANVDWRPRIWHNKPIGILATLYDLSAGRRQAIRIAREIDAEIVHCRSYIASLMGLAVKRATGAKFVFDMRGFWPDERVDGRIWSRSSVPYRIFKRVERSLFLNADHIVSLTKAGIREYEAFEYMRGIAPKSTVIPTCTNLDMFRPETASREGFTLGYVGSIGSWYLFDEVARAVTRAFALRSDARFLVVTKGNHDRVRKALDKAGADPKRIQVLSADFSEVAHQIGRMDAGIFFIRPAWSKRASCPTRMGEFLACGKPCLANGGVGDVAEDIRETGT